ncbi:MAG: hypothetical protein HRU43_02880 [Simkaniaceae bacterium]|nr:hypothetical protein [Simkaniaceae bacterium]
MSISPIFKSSPESPKSHSIEIDEAIPKEYIERASAAAERFFENELPGTAKKTRDWVREIIVPAMVEAEKGKCAVSENEVTLFLESVSKRMDSMLDKLEEINFSRGHELLCRYTYPTVAEFEPITSWLLDLTEKYSLYEGQEGFTSKFQKAFQPFFDELTNTIHKQALASRNLQYQQILANPQDKEFEFNKAVTEAHICALETDPNQTLLELRDLLNLRKHPKIGRVPTMEEQEAFQFLFAIAKLKKS